MLRIYNTLTRDKQPFVPLVPGKVGMYVCGMTIYDYCHLGHGRMLLAWDVIVRWLRASGYAVTYVRNITDVDDKIIRRAVENNEPIHALTDRMTLAMHQDTELLGCTLPDLEPRATGFISQMLDIVQRLQDQGLAYQGADGDMNFAVRKFEGYGKLSGKSLDELRAGERIAVDSAKRDPLDFALWKRAKEGEPPEATWDSPFGRGRPGWHIECSAMARSVLGQPFDIHGGGPDLPFPHHENEIAQSEGAFGTPLANVWMHNGALRMGVEKMSKSLGNFFTIRDILKEQDAEVVRFFLVRTHYRSAIAYGSDVFDDARAGLARLYTALNEVTADDAPLDWTQAHAARFKDAMDDDFNTALAMAALFDLASEINRSKSAALARQLVKLGAILGLLQRNPQAFLQGTGGAAAGLSDDQIQTQIQARADAKTQKQFALADEIRQSLLAQGIVLEDKPGGLTQWRRG